MKNEDKRKDKDQEIKDYKKRERDSAIDLVKQCSDVELKGYIQPTRTGTPKGDPIGFSHKKYQATHLMVLHPISLKLKDISNIVGVSEGVLRVWRTEKEFKKATEEFGISVAKRITNIIEALVDSKEIDIIKKSGENTISLDGVLKVLKSESKKVEAIKNKFKGEITKIVEIDDTRSMVRNSKKFLKDVGFDDPIDFIMILIRLFLFFNSSVTEPFAKWLKKSIDSNTGATYLFLAEYALKVASVDDTESLRRWETNPHILEITKLIIEINIDFLIGLAIRGDYGEDTQEVVDSLKKSGDSLKKLIINNLDLLAQ